MDYTSAPATQLVATACAVCCRPLLDALAVEAGIGPVCRETYGYHVTVDPAARAEANRLVYMLAAQACDVPSTLVRLAVLGFQTLAERIAQNIVTVRIEPSTRFGFDGLAVTTPFDPEALKAFRAIPGRRFDVAAKVWVVPTEQRAAVWALLRRHFAGALAVGPKGLFQITPAVEVVS